jgi:general secretion pathway protein D
VLGGLIDSQDRKVVTRVPILGYIPILGLLFQSHKTEKVKKDLMIFLRPIIITNPKTADAITQQRYNFMKDVAVLSRDGRTEMTAASILPKQDETLPAPFHESK